MARTANSSSNTKLKGTNESIVNRLGSSIPMIAKTMKTIRLSTSMKTKEYATAPRISFVDK